MSGGHPWRWVGLAALSAACAAVLLALSWRPAGVGRAEWVLGRPGDPPTMQAVCVAVDPAGRRVAVGNRAGEVGVWEADGPRPLWRWPAHPEYTTADGFTPDGEMVLSAGCDLVLRRWGLAPDRPALRSETTAPGRVLALAFAPDGRSMGSGAIGGVTVWRVGASGLTPVAGAVVPGWPVHALAFSPAGDRLAFAAGDNVVRLWRPGGADGPTSVAVSEHCHVRGLGFDMGGRRLAALDTWGRVLRWDLDTGEERDGWLAVPACRTVAFTADLRPAVIAHHAGTTRMVALPGELTEP